MAKTLEDVRIEVAYRLQDPGFVVWKSAEIDGYIQEGYDRLTADAMILWKHAEPAGLQDVAGQALYNLPTDLVKVDRVTWNNWRIRPVSQYEMQRMSSNFRTEQGEVRLYMIETDGLHVLRKIRVPSSTAAVVTAIEYYHRGAALALGSTPFEIPDRFCKYVRFYAMSRCYERRGHGQNPKLSDHYRLRYDIGVARTKEHKARVLSARVGRLGDARPTRQSGPPRPRLPWNFGKVVK